MTKRKENTLLQLEKLLSLPVLTFKQSVRWLIKHQSFAIEHLPDKEELIFKVFKNCVLVLMLIKKSPKFKKKIMYMLEYQQKSKWTTFLDKLNILESLNSLTMMLLKILVQELILKEKAYRPFWTPAYKEISEKLLLPIGTDYTDLVTNSSIHWSQSQVAKSQFLNIQTTKHVNKNLQKVCSPLSMYSLVDKWENEVIPIVKIKTLRIRFFPTIKQRIILDEFINTFRYVYNKTLEIIKNGHKANFQDLRDKIVTENTKKHYDEYKQYEDEIKILHEAIKLSTNDIDKAKIKLDIKVKYAELRNHLKTFPPQKNTEIHEFELFTPKDIRSNAVKRCCDAYKSGFTNLKHGHIKSFNLKYKKKTEARQSIELTPKNISIIEGKIRILPETFKNDCFLKITKNNEVKYKTLVIKHNVDIIKEKGKYYIHIPMETELKEPTSLDRIAGIDLGIRTFGTVHTSSIGNKYTEITEYTHRRDILKNLNKKINVLKYKIDHKVRKKQFNKIEGKKKNLVNKLHWDFINDVLEHNDVIYLGDINSHNIVKHGKNSSLNREFNDLKFYILKQRLIYKASLYNKIVVLVPEHYTTKSCSSCGELNHNVGSKETFTCQYCNLCTGRDMNASKNMIMKGLLM